MPLVIFFNFPAWRMRGHNKWFHSSYPIDWPPILGLKGISQKGKDFPLPPLFKERWRQVMMYQSCNINPNLTVANPSLHVRSSDIAYKPQWRSNNSEVSGKSSSRFVSQIAPIQSTYPYIHTYPHTYIKDVYEGVCDKRIRQGERTGIIQEVKHISPQMFFGQMSNSKTWG